MVENSRKIITQSSILPRVKQRFFALGFSDFFKYPFRFELRVQLFPGTFPKLPDFSVLSFLGEQQEKKNPFSVHLHSSDNRRIIVHKEFNIEDIIVANVTPDPNACFAGTPHNGMTEV